MSDEPTPRVMWRICVDVPADAIDDDAKNALFTAVCDAVYGWEPEQRDGWDTDVWATSRFADDDHESTFWEAYREEAGSNVWLPPGLDPDYVAFIKERAEREAREDRR